METSDQQSLLSVPHTVTQCSESVNEVSDHHQKEHESWRARMKEKFKRNKSPQSTSGGTFVFRSMRVVMSVPIDLLEYNNLYCKVKVGMHSYKTQAALENDCRASWPDILVFKAKDHQFAKLKLKGMDQLKLMREKLGEAKANLNTARFNGKSTERVKLWKNSVIVGEVQFELAFDPHGTFNVDK